MTINLSASAKAARSTAMKSTIDADGSAGSIKIYTAPRPASGAAPGSAVLLATLPLAYPSGTVDAAGFHLTSSLPAQAVASGTAAWARISDNSGDYVMDGDAGVSGDSNIDFVLDNKNLLVGGFVVLTGGLLAEGG